VPLFNGDAGDVAARPRQARRESSLDRVATHPTYRHCAVSGARRPRDAIAKRNSHVRVPFDDLASEVVKALGPPLAGIALDGEVLSLDVAQPAQLLEKRPPEGRSRLTDVSDGTRGDDDRNPVMLRRLLRQRRRDCSREQQTHREIAPPHSGPTFVGILLGVASDLSRLRSSATSAFRSRRQRFTGVAGASRVARAKGMTDLHPRALPSSDAE